MFSDSGWGFMVWDAMRRGSPFNYFVMPDQTDIARDTASFMTWWSPGQYWVPGILELAGFSLGHAIVLVVGIASGIGLTGWFYLYRAFGFSDRSIALSLLIISFSRFCG
jgi:hypothetical protein